LAAVRVDPGPLALVLVPALGGKVASLRDTRSGREWLWRHPRMAYRPGPAASYVASADTGGWDECFPSVAPCAYPEPPWQSAAIADHGELWSQTAALDVLIGDDTVALRTRWQGRALPYLFERTIRLDAGSARLRCAYRVESLAYAPIHFIWCAHPLLAIEPGMALELPADARYNVWGQAPAGLLDREHGLAFPPQLATLPPPDSALALKLWSDPLPAGAGQAGIRAADGALRMRWDVSLLPQVALWMNLGAFGMDGGAPYYNLGIEPCIGAQDSLALAVTDEGLSALLEPRAAREWWMEIELTA
jgi:galactose mutarotase-like enzyme